MKYKSRQKFSVMIKDNGGCWAGDWGMGKGKIGTDWKGAQESFLEEWNVLDLDRGIGYTVYSFVKTHRTQLLGLVYFIIHKLYLNRAKKQLQQDHFR